MEKEIKIILGIGIIIGAVVLILWVAGVFKKSTRQTMTEPLSMGKPIFNTYILSPNDIWEYWDETGYKTRGTNIQLIVNELFVAQNDKKTAEYGHRRVLIFLLPGVYVNLHIQVGYYTSVAGLGGNAADTVVQGSIEVPNDDDPCIGALENNFRNISNLTIKLDKTIMQPDQQIRSPFPQRERVLDEYTNYFRVSKGSPIRNITVGGLDDGKPANFSVGQFNGGCQGNRRSGGYSSGGFISNSLIRDGRMRYATQQQFFSRNCDYDIHSAISGGGGVWNIYLLGCIAQAGKTFHDKEVFVSNINKCPSNLHSKDLIRDPAFITLKDQTPGLMASIPQIRYNQDTETFSILKPPLVNNSSGVLDIDGKKLSNVFIVVFTTSIKTINKKLEDGVHLIFSPGVYYFAEPVRITRSGTVVMTLGYATLIPTGGEAAIIIDSAAEGVRLSGFILQAGREKSEALLLVGDQPRQGGSAANPSIIYDVVCRVGGGQIEPGEDSAVVNPDKVGACESMVVVNQNYTVIDNMWCWRASHVSEIPSVHGIFFSKVNHGIVVKGDRVRMFGVAVEHTLKEQILWEGAYGELYFQTLVLPYDVSGDWAFPGLRVTGRHFKGSGLGVYSLFETTYNEDRKEAAPKVPTAILTYNKDDKEVIASSEIESAFTVFLSSLHASGSIESVFNGKGPASNISNASDPQWCGTMCPDNTCKCQFPYSRWC